LNTPGTLLRRDIRVFISAVSRELGTVRQLVKKALEDSGYHAVEQDTFPLDYRDVVDKLRNMLDSCDAVIHIAGQCFGTEPRQQPDDTTRQSYTQLEYTLARELGKRVYVFITDDAFPTDPHAVEDEAHGRLQAAHRQVLMQTDQDYYRAISREDIDQKVRSLHLQREILTAELTRTDDRVVAIGRRQRRWLILILVVGLATLGYVVWQMEQQQQSAYVTVEFKNSPLLTPGRQKHILRVLTSFHDYLTALRFEIPKKVPFILGTAPRKTPTGQARYPGTPYDNETLIPEHAIRNDELIQELYARFVFNNLLMPYEPVLSNFFGISSLTFSIYYLSSYRGIKLCQETDKWCNALWDIRKRYGQEFPDKLLFYAFQKWQPPSMSESNYNEYFMRRFFLGMRVAANDFDKQAPVVIAILKARGLDPE
jgi:hypothetical protein